MALGLTVASRAGSSTSPSVFPSLNPIEGRREHQQVYSTSQEAHPCSSAPVWLGS